MTFKFTPNPTFAEDLKRDPEWKRFAMDKAQDAARIGQTHASKGFMGPASDLQAESTPTGAALVHSNSGWHLEEYGAPHSAPRAPLRKGIEGAGMKFEPK